MEWVGGVEMEVRRSVERRYREAVGLAGAGTAVEAMAGMVAGVMEAAVCRQARLPIRLRLLLALGLSQTVAPQERRPTRPRARMALWTGLRD